MAAPQYSDDMPLGPEDYDDFEDECSNCGGEGFVYDCDEPFACVDPEGGCDLCMRRCDWCNRKPRPSTNHTPTGEREDT